MATGADLDAALGAARAAGEVLLAHFGSSSGLREKTSRHDLVTDADFDADARIRSVLEAAFPDDAIVTEERGGEPPAAGRTWFVDPLDGTTNFVHGFPHWCVSIALELGDRILAAVVHDPLRGETFFGRTGGGANLGGTRLVVARAPLREALVGINARQAIVRESGGVRALALAARDVREPGATALDLAWVAAGRLNALAYNAAAPAWDRLAGECLVREADGTVASWPGEPRLALAGPAALIEEIRETPGGA